MRVKEVADFKVYTKGAGSGELRVQVKGPSMCGITSFFFYFNIVKFGIALYWCIMNCVLGGGDEPVKVQEVGDGVYECNYYPIFSGKYIITITWGGHAIPRR